MSRHSTFFRPLTLIATCLLSTQVLAASPCPDDEKPRMTVHLKEQEHVLYVCGYLNEEDRPAKGFRSYSDLKIFAKQAPDPKKAKKKKPAKKSASASPDPSPSPPPEPKLIFESSTLENFWVKKEKETFLLDEVWPIIDQPTPVLRRKVVCKPKACKLSKPECLHKPKKKPHPEALKELREAMKAPRDEAGAEDPDAKIKVLVGQTFAQALSGDTKARSFFLNGKKPVELKGDASDEWHAAKGYLGRARKLGCLR